MASDNFPHPLGLNLNLNRDIWWIQLLQTHRPILHCLAATVSNPVARTLSVLIFLFKMNLVPKMNLIRVEKVNLKNTRVLKKNLFVVLGDGAEFGPLLF